MTISADMLLRLQFLVRVTQKECRHLLVTDQSLFACAFTLEHAKRLETDQALSERVEAFVGRFSRLQDTLGDKLLPILLLALGEIPAAVIDNLDRAERLGLIASADQWLVMRKLRNQMVHEYVEDPEVLINALQAGHEFVPVLVDTCKRFNTEIQQRGWADIPV